MDLTKVNKQAVDQLVSLFVWLAELLLLVRVVLRFFNGNPDATFVHWVYTNTQVLLEPLRNVFTSVDVVNRGWVVDYVALAAMAFWAVVGYLMVGLVSRWVRK
ncbi:YggT family protein [Candidatus Saccharibacteria bacterium]|nr:YggT family protein [Candidatus Saccharibacteria bacterium]